LKEPDMYVPLMHGCHSFTCAVPPTT